MARLNSFIFYWYCTLIVCLLCVHKIIQLYATFFPRLSAPTLQVCIVSRMKGEGYERNILEKIVIGCNVQCSILLMLSKIEQLSKHKCVTLIAKHSFRFRLCNAIIIFYFDINITIAKFLCKLLYFVPKYYFYHYIGYWQYQIHLILISFHYCQRN